MTAALIYLACAVVTSVGLFAWDKLDNGGWLSATGVVLYSIVWPLVWLGLLGLACGVALGWLEGMLP